MTLYSFFKRKREPLLDWARRYPNSLVTMLECHGAISLVTAREQDYRSNKGIPHFAG